MDCPNCQLANREEAVFCLECGAELGIKCPNCEKTLPPRAKFCDTCGRDLKQPKESEAPAPEPAPAKDTPSPKPIESERKHVTALFSDLSGYTAMSEILDPEEIKEITGKIFDEISKIISKYEGFVEKFAGDAVMALFGATEAHEDDPVRAIKAAREIHSLVNSLSPQYEERIEQPLVMHSGINTGLVVTGDVNLEKGIHGVAGDTINLASRLSSLAKAGEVLVDADTFRQAEGHFIFKALEPALVKGKADPVQVHKVLSQRDKPVTIRRLSGLRADLIGRKGELAELREAVENLREGKGRIFSICGAAGTGKSRLVEEFKAKLDLEDIQWLEGHAYAYAQNIPYFPMIDLLNKVFQIEEEDSPEKIREKIESGVEQFVGQKEDVVPYVGGLYSLSYPELEDVSPELWKYRLHESIQAILTALATRAPTVFLLEDLHWADLSFVDLLRRVCLEIRQPAIVLCVYRPTISLFTSHQLSGLGKFYHEIRLQDLSLSDAQDMLESLLKTGSIPSDLKRLVQSKAEGNPFYLEELVNSLIESETLVRDNGSWKITKPFAEADISSSIHGLIAGRLDRLEKETKRILQQASVIGRAFLYEILKKTTELKDRIDGDLSILERIDLIRTRTLQPDLEYMFKHALTQEVVYNSLLKKERQEIHKQIAIVMEQLFHDRLPEFYETLAFHFTRGRSAMKAVDYLVKSGEKCLARYAVVEAHQYFKEAFDILASKTDKSKAEKVALIDILNSWGYAYYYLGDFKEFINLFKSQKDVAESLDDKARIGMFYAWFGIALWMSGKSKDSYEYLSNGLELGEKSGNQKVVGYACTWLTWTCAELGLFDEGIGFGERAQKIAESFPSDQYLFFKSLGGLTYINWMKGETKKVFEGAKLLLDYGERKSNNRSKVFGHWTNSFGHHLRGDIESAQKNSEKAGEVALDPLYSTSFTKITLGLAHLLGGRFQEAEDVLQSALDFCEKRAIGQISELAYLFIAPTLITKGHMRQGLGILEKAQQALIRNQRRMWYGISEHILGQVYSQMVTGPTPAFSIMAKNIGFLVKNVPFASKKAEEHFNKAIEVIKEIGAKGFLGAVYLDMGLFYKARKRTDQARECISKAIQVFEECEAEVYMKQAKEALASL
jgi:class 3 adenylate cyclase/tetratricopeptide (TPR) repeat protein